MISNFLHNAIIFHLYHKSAILFLRPKKTKLHRNAISAKISFPQLENYNLRKLLHVSQNIYGRHLLQLIFAPHPTPHFCNLTEIVLQCPLLLCIVTFVQVLLQ